MEGLIEAVRRITEGREGYGGTSAFPTAIEGLTLLRSDHERSPSLVLYRPCLCVALQGRKETTFGTLRLDCGPGEALMVGIATPASGRVVEASPESPYLGLVIELDTATLREVLEEIEAPAPPAGGAEDRAGAGVFRVGFGGPLAECAGRMVGLLETPRAIPALAPAIRREMSYWLLTGPHAGEVCRVARLGGPTRAIVDAIRLLRERFAEPVRGEELARAANMSLSTFHVRFRALTATSPLQYQKQLRLHEARRLLVASEENVEGAAFRVGYESPSQFSREYARAFGRPPGRDVAGARGAG